MDQLSKSKSVKRFVSRLYNKSDYALKINKSHSWVNKLIAKGELIEFTIGKTNFVYVPENK